jgi:hypothetical protein
MHRWIPLFNALLLSPKNFTSIFSFKRNSQKTKKLRFMTIFGSHTNKWGLRPELSLCLTSTYPQQQLTAISFESATKIFFEKTMTMTFYQICTRKKHLNGRSSLIRHNMIMNYTPLDSSFQCASFESKKFYLALFV